MVVPAVNFVRIHFSSIQPPIHVVKKLFPDDKPLINACLLQIEREIHQVAQEPLHIDFEIASRAFSVHSLHDINHAVFLNLGNVVHHGIFNVF